MKTTEKPNWELKGVNFITQEPIKDAFINMVQKFHNKSEAEATATWEREITYFKKAMSESQKLQSATNVSLYSVLVDIAQTGLSIQPGSKSEAYLESRGSKTGQKTEKGEDIYQESARLVITAYGELNMRIKSGQIIRMKNPIVLYEGDVFQPRTNQRGELYVEYLPSIPRKSQKIFGCYACIELPGGSLDFKWLLEDDIQRLAKYSTPRPTKWNQNPEANALYSANGGQIDPGFLEAKTIKHAMRAYTKLHVGESVAFEDDDLIPNGNQPDNFDQQSDNAGQQSTGQEPADQQPEAPQGGVVVQDDSNVF